MELKDNSGVIFRNEKKTSENHPDYRGEINVNGHYLEISLWVKTSKDGKKYFSAALSEPYRKPEPKPEPEPFDEPGDSLPF